MKVKQLLIFVSLATTSLVVAQVDVTPANWKFSAKERGSASAVFIKSASTIGGNLIYSKTTSDGRKGFRAGDAMEGSIAVNHWTGEGDNIDYSAMTIAQKEKIDAFHEAFKFVDGGELGNLLCYKGKTATFDRPGAFSNTANMVAPSLNMFTQKDLAPGVYKVTLNIRTIMNTNVTPKTISCYVASSWYDNMKFAGSSTGLSFNVDCAPEFNNEWTTYEYEFQISNNSDPLYDETPVNTKLGLGTDIANNTIILMSSLKLEKMNVATLGGKVKISYPVYNDLPTGVEQLKQNELIVWGEDRTITIVDAKAPIEVYSANGQLVKCVDANSTLTTVPVDEMGIYIIKSGNQIRKIVL